MLFCLFGSLNVVSTVSVLIRKKLYSPLKYCCHAKRCIILCLVMFQEHHEEDLFLYMTYSNESVYGAWVRTKDWRKRKRENERRQSESVWGIKS